MHESDNQIDVSGNNIKNINRIHINKKRLKVLVCILVILSLTVFVYAKFIAEYMASSNVPSGVSADYYMDVIWDNKNDSDSANDDDEAIRLSQMLDLEELNPGDKQLITFAVRNGHVKERDQDNQAVLQISDIDLNYTIEIIHTQNLPLIYNLYEYVGEDNGDTVGENGEKSKYRKITGVLENSIFSNSTNKYENKGVREIYKKGFLDEDAQFNDSGSDFILKRKRTFSKTENDITIRNYLLEIEWPKEENKNPDGVKYSNEVELVYLVVNGTQK